MDKNYPPDMVPAPSDSFCGHCHWTIYKGLIAFFIDRNGFREFFCSKPCYESAKVGEPVQFSTGVSS